MNILQNYIRLQNLGKRFLEILFFLDIFSFQVEDYDSEEERLREEEKARKRQVHARVVSVVGFFRLSRLAKVTGT